MLKGYEFCTALVLAIFGIGTGSVSYAAGAQPSVEVQGAKDSSSVNLEAYVCTSQPSEVHHFGQRACTAAIDQLFNANFAKANNVAPDSPTIGVIDIDAVPSVNTQTQNIMNLYYAGQVVDPDYSMKSGHSNYCQEVDSSGNTHSVPTPVCNPLDTHSGSEVNQNWKSQSCGAGPKPDSNGYCDLAVLEGGDGNMADVCPREYAYIRGIRPQVLQFEAAAVNSEINPPTPSTSTALKLTTNAGVTGATGEHVCSLYWNQLYVLYNGDKSDPANPVYGIKDLTNAVHSVNQVLDPSLQINEYQGCLSVDQAGANVNGTAAEASAQITQLMSQISQGADNGVSMNSTGNSTGANSGSLLLNATTGAGTKNTKLSQAFCYLVYGRIAAEKAFNRLAQCEAQMRAEFLINTSSSPSQPGPLQPGPVFNYLMTAAFQPCLLKAISPSCQVPPGSTFFTTPCARANFYSCYNSGLVTSTLKSYFSSLPSPPVPSPSILLPSPAQSLYPPTTTTNSTTPPQTLPSCNALFLAPFLGRRSKHAGRRKKQGFMKSLSGLFVKLIVLPLVLGGALLLGLSPWAHATAATVTPECPGQGPGKPANLNSSGCMDKAAQHACQEQETGTIYPAYQKDYEARINNAISSCFTIMDGNGWGSNVSGTGWQPLTGTDLNECSTSNTSDHDYFGKCACTTSNRQNAYGISTSGWCTSNVFQGANTLCAADLGFGSLDSLANAYGFYQASQDLLNNENKLLVAEHTARVATCESISYSGPAGDNCTDAVNPYDGTATTTTLTFPRCNPNILADGVASCTTTALNLAGSCPSPSTPAVDPNAAGPDATVSNFNALGPFVALLSGMGVLKDMSQTPVKAAYVPVASNNSDTAAYKPTGTANSGISPNRGLPGPNTAALAPGSGAGSLGSSGSSSGSGGGLWGWSDDPADPNADGGQTGNAMGANGPNGVEGISFGSAGGSGGGRPGSPDVEVTDGEGQKTVEVGNFGGGRKPASFTSAPGEDFLHGAGDSLFAVVNRRYEIVTPRITAR